MLPVSALAGFGDGRVNATISGLSLPGEQLALKTVEKIGVRPAYQRRPLTAAQCCGSAWRPPAAPNGRLCRANYWGQLLLSGKPPLNLARYVRELKAYPYGCLEQTASGLFPSLYTSAAQLSAGH
ncbi:hypothetical protein MJ575_21795 [Klebsiella pneumoniae]|nr:hypothetical protein MJ575_21795 [Klebsiella pneumoniae]